MMSDEENVLARLIDWGNYLTAMCANLVSSSGGHTGEASNSLPRGLNFFPKLPLPSLGSSYVHRLLHNSKQCSCISGL